MKLVNDKLTAEQDRVMGKIDTIYLYDLWDVMYNKAGYNVLRNRTSTMPIRYELDKT